MERRPSIDPREAELYSIMHTSAPQPAHYIHRRELSRLVLAHRKQPARHRVVSDALALAFIKIAGGVWDRFRFTSSREDFVQEVVTYLMERPLRRADPRRNLFAYFTTCCVRRGQNLREKVTAETQRFNDYAQHIVDEGRPHVTRSRRSEDLDD
jgi:hypothetical protein